MTTALVLVASTTAAGLVTSPTPAVLAAAGPASAFTPVQPCRLLDTRREPPGRLRDAGSVDVRATGRCQVPAAATAVALNVTVVAPTRSGFLTTWPTGEARPEAAILTYGPGDVRSNSTLARVGRDGLVATYSLAATDLVIDVTGYFAPSPGGAQAGRLVTVAPHRLVDTRLGRRPGAGGVVRVRADVPADAVAVAVNIATTASNGPDFLTAYAAGAPRPTAAVLSIDRAGQTRATSAVVPVVDGQFDVYTDRGNHVIADITGYFTGPSADHSDRGLFVPAVPARLFDTRTAFGARGGPKLFERGGREFDPFVLSGGPVSAIAANWTVTDTEDRGYWLAHPAGRAFGEVSTVNADGGQQTVANAAITEVSTRGVAVHASEGADVVADLAGWFTGPPAAVEAGARPTNSPPHRRVTIISDSAMAGVRWNGALAGFAGFEVDARLESCRRLVQWSCRGREGYRPRTARDEILALAPAGPNDIVVIATGYNDWHAGFSSDFDAVVAAARARGFHHVAWVNYRTNVSYHLPGSSLRSNYTMMDHILAAKRSSGAFPEVRVWDLDHYSAAAVGWFYADGVHETLTGSWAVADWVSRHVAAFDDKPCPKPWWPGGQIELPCPDPDPLFAQRGQPDIRALYGL